MTARLTLLPAALLVAVLACAGTADAQTADPVPDARSNPAPTTARGNQAAPRTVPTPRGTNVSAYGAGYFLGCFLGFAILVDAVSARFRFLGKALGMSSDQ